MNKIRNSIGIAAIILFIVWGAIALVTAPAASTGSGVSVMQTPGSGSGYGQTPASGTSSTASGAAASSGTATTTTSGTTAPTLYTLADVAMHSTSASCWTAINGNVYDLTNWIGQHPGGPEHILSICGKDGTAAFENQHGNSPQPNDILATFKIGTLTS